MEFIKSEMHREKNLKLSIASVNCEMISNMPTCKVSISEGDKRKRLTEKNSKYFPMLVKVIKLLNEEA
jgi:hypothetical protein